jgi:hypothetical protein
MSGRLMVDMVFWRLFGLLVVIATVVLSGLLLGFPLKWCWNFVVPYVTNGVVPEIGFWHALALWLLSSTLVQSKLSVGGK